MRFDAEVKKNRDTIYIVRGLVESSSREHLVAVAIGKIEKLSFVRDTFEKFKSIKLNSYRV